MKNERIELLSPAKNIDVGLAAINHGADAVYIGPSRFGARMSAGNSVSDIESLVKYAHKYYAKVYVALNTILNDSELEDARRLIYELYDAGADALIVQDMGLLEIDLPPIALHASTQCDTRTAEKVMFLEQCGFEQVVLARETSLQTMREIALQTNVSLEAFIHGALCVCYSGQCYMSEYARGRSANRGACAQMCRLPYDLTDDTGNVIVRQKHLLSLKDFDASGHVRDMIDAGISSFKIEGRLKDENYVKNITAYYRKIIDCILERDTLRRQSSSGKTHFFFTPDPRKTFFRGSTTYFLNDRQRNIWSFDTPKSMGEPVGRVKDIWRNALSIDRHINIVNGDGLCFFNKENKFEGFRVNRVEDGRLIPFKMPAGIYKGTLLYRNQDAAFDKILKGKTSERKILLKIKVDDTDNGFLLSAIDEDGIESSLNVFSLHTFSNNTERAGEVWRNQLSKIGNTDFSVVSVCLDGLDNIWFVPASKLTDWRRELINNHIEARQQAYKRPNKIIKPTTHKYVVDQLDYRGNVYNTFAERFYKRHGVVSVSPAFEKEPTSYAELMRTRHCIRYALGICPKYCDVKDTPKRMFLSNGNDKFELSFDCSKCEMVIKPARHLQK